jgi:hypothetical protein
MKLSAAKCVYCGVQEGTTRDHIPPKSLFSRPRPTLVTVPCCETCRREQPMDDEYFLRMIAMRSDVGRHISIAPVVDSVHRSFTRPPSLRFTQALLRSISERAVYSSADIYLGQATTYDVDLNRLCKVIERITRGLYFSEYQQRLPDDHACKSYALDGFPAGNSHLSRLLAVALTGKCQTFGDKVFTYWIRRIESLTLWAFLVYGCVGFLALTKPNDVK